MAYSLDLRERIVATVKEGVKQPEVAERFKVSLSSVERYLRRERQSCEPSRLLVALRLLRLLRMER